MYISRHDLGSKNSKLKKKKQANLNLDQKLNDYGYVYEAKNQNSEKPRMISNERQFRTKYNYYDKLLRSFKRKSSNPISKSSSHQTFDLNMNERSNIDASSRSSSFISSNLFLYSYEKYKYFVLIIKRLESNVHFKVSDVKTSYSERA